MGLTSSTQYNVQTQQERIINASKKFHARIRAYNYAIHGSYHDYVNWCHAQFQLECIPEDCLQGPNYRPNRYGDEYY